MTTATTKHTRPGARERISALCDEFTEIGAARSDIGANQSGVITGFGSIGGADVAVYAQDFSYRGGTVGQVEADKICDLLDHAMALRMPVIAILDSGGARIQEGVNALAGYGRIFRRTVAASGVIPQITIIAGPTAGGAVYCPALTDLIIMVKEEATMFVTGPTVVKAVTGEDIDTQDLGGSTVHAQVSGVADYEAIDEADAFDYVRSVLAYLPHSVGEDTPRYFFDNGASSSPGVAVDLRQLVPADTSKAYDIVPLITTLVDYGELVQVKPDFARNIVCGFACFDGRPVGIIANQPAVGAGCLDIDASEKAARFLRMCDSFGLPIVSLVDVPGYLPGSDQEHAGIIRRGAKLLAAYADATVPLITIIVRKSYGGAFIVMGSKSMGADFAYSWADAEIAVMGAAGAVDIIHRREITADPARRQELVDAYTRDVVTPAAALASGELDGIIEPADTRATIVRALQISASKRAAAVTTARAHANLPL